MSEVHRGGMDGGEESSNGSGSGGGVTDDTLHTRTKDLPPGSFGDGGRSAMDAHKKAEEARNVEAANSRGFQAGSTDTERKM